MRMKLVACAAVLSVLFLGLTVALAGFLWAQFQTGVSPQNLTQGVAVQQERLHGLQAELAKTISSAPERVMKQSGLAGAMGGTHVKVTSGDFQEILLPIPQLSDCQVPICFFIGSAPADAVTEFRLRKREDSNVVVGVRLAGKKGEVQISWSSVVLLAPTEVTPNTTAPDPYCKATSCVQSEAAEIKKLASDTWPRSSKASEFAVNIQQHIREMKRKQQPRSLDALGILRSGESGICTANANLASALMRSKGIACRSIAVIPPLSQRLEMHRIVEFYENGRWVPFDPSSLQIDLPAKPWQNVIMAKTTVWDEQMAMKPRMASMIGCPYGQEVEMLSSGVNLHGQDFYWTTAKPLADFEPTDAAIRLALEGWNRFLETGTLTQGQVKAAAAKTAMELVECLQVQ
jgi:hypothetical protein